MRGNVSQQANPILDPIALNARLELLHPNRILEWAWATFSPHIRATSSFQTQSLPLLHMISRVTPEMTVIFLDTGFHFNETLLFRDQLVGELGLLVEDVLPGPEYGGSRRQRSELHRTDPDMCCYLNKVEPLQRAKTGLSAWVTGIRRDQTPARREAPIVSLDKDGRYKICPLANWTDREVWQYINKHDLPVHPLLAQGYMSIGCAPCTRPVSADEDYRAGRWADRQKTECGLHDHTARTTVVKQAAS